MKKFKLLIILLLIASLLGCTAVPAPISTQADPAESAATAGTSVSSASSLLTVHYLDVGQADCMLLECDGEYLLIDGGNVDDSSLVVSYLEQTGVETLSAVVCSHAHEDHVGGLAGVLSVFPTEAVYAPTRTYSSRCFDDFLYYTDQQGLEVQIPNPGDTLTLGDTHITVLGPVTSYAETNDTSIILLAQHGENRFLFTGDMETTAEADLLDTGTDLRADVLKVGHHGSSTSTSYRFLYEVDPDYAVIPVGTDNTYGHPHDEVVSRLYDAGVPIFRTDLLGTILAVSDGQEITLTWSRSDVAPDNAAEAELVYIGNINSLKVHLPSCTGLPEEKNRITFPSLEEALDAGYTPCGRCME